MQVLALECRQGTMIVPIPMVAQVVGRVGLSEARSTLDSVRSAILWREYRIPLVYTSELLGGLHGADEDFSRAVVIWPMKGFGPTDMFALSSLSSPRVLVVDEETRFSSADIESNVPDLGGYASGRVQMEEGDVIVPDLVKLSGSLF